MANSLNDRLVLVTGGTGGVGRGVVAELSAEGATVVTTAHRPQTIEGVQVEVADLLVPATIQPLIDRVIQGHARIDALVCLVGGFAGGTFIQTDHHTWTEMVEL